MPPRKTADNKGKTESRRCSDWTIEVSDMGRISTASISSAPLLLLLGKNNSGKSYVASLLWALGQMHLMEDFPGEPKLPEWYEAFLDNIAKIEQPRELVLSVDKVRDLRSWYNDAWATCAPQLLKTIFSFDGFKPTKVAFSSSCDYRCVFKIAMRPIAMKGVRRSQKELRFSFEDENKEQLLFEIPFSERIPSFVHKFFYQFLLNAALFGNVTGVSGTYIPAARTGLMLTYRSYLSSLISAEGERDASQKSQFALPTRSFLQSIVWGSDASPTATAYSDIADWIEGKLLNGTIVQSGSMDSIEFSYKLDSGVVLPLHVSSSMITELVPFVIALRRGWGLDQVVFEEPEAHLHLSAQRIMAIAIVRLVNAGARVIVTSHSDTFVQQISNLMHLNKFREESILSELGYTLQDTIDPENVKGYEFIDHDGMTQVNELQKIAEGIVAPSLNLTIENLQDEALRLQEEASVDRRGS